MANVMKDVAKLLGLELEEEFRIESYDSKYKLTRDGLRFWSVPLQDWVLSSIIGELLSGERKITKLPKPILNDAEKEYLGNIIKPFRNRIIWIGKSVYIPGEYIEIYLRHYDDGCSSYSIILPYFKKGTMYKGMELDKEYTLEELGL